MSTEFSAALAGAVSAAFSTASVYPLDTVKTYLNKGTDESGTQLRSLNDVLTRVVFKHGYNLSGLRSLYAGLESKISMSMTQKFLYFYVYNYMLRQAKTRLGKISVFTNLIIGYLSAIVAVGILTPFEIAQTRQQLDPSEKRSIFAIIKDIVENEGVAGLYTGIHTNLILCVNPAIDYSVFDQVRRWRLKKTGRRGLSDGEAFWLGAFSKAVATVLTFPHVRAKLLQQAGVERFKNMDSSSILVSLLVTDGVTSLFAGMRTQLVKNVLASAIMMTAKERIELSVVRAMAGKP